MWQASEVMPDSEPKYNNNNNNNLCTKSLLHNLVKSRRIGSASSSSLDQQSNSSSLESLESLAMDGNQALSTSCSEDSFEMSSTTSKPTNDDPSQHSFQYVNLTSSILNSENLIQPSNATFAYSDAKPSSCDDGSDQMSRDSLEPCSSLEKSSSLRTTDKTDPLSLTSFHSERSIELDDLQGIYHDNATLNVNVSRDKERITELRHSTPNTTWRSTSSVVNIGSAKKDKSSLREYIDKELDNLDTCLPQLDFNKLEEKLNNAARERVVTERKLLGEQVDQYTAGPVPRVYTRPSRSNLGFRLQTAMNLQVCYINDLKEDEEEKESSDDDFSVPKSKSAPNLRNSVIDGSSLKASQLRQAVSAYREKRQVLEEETKMMLAKAKQAAKMQMEIEKLNTDRSTTAIPPKASRLQLSKMTRGQLIEISEKISKRIDEENAELMRLLVEKDSLYMQQDSMLVDIEDMIQHESNSESLNLPDFLKVQATPPVTMSKFRIFKR
uniref:Schwannomin interacting protein 1 C-terminal domain-containing protein n=1 Tax=Setaria digitata TaxID=48799 RepID=A0A915Q5D3_9BILA